MKPKKHFKPVIFKQSSVGFTLIELAVVILIIGLIVGGIMAGQALLKSSQLKTVVTEQKNFSQIALTFKSKYMSLPGDMPDAITIWGAAHTTPSTCDNTAGNGTETCNGDGNGLISAIQGTDDHERTRFWQHLQNAKLMNGNLPGNTVSATNYGTRFDINLPASKYDQAGWTVNFLGWGDGVLTFAGATKGKHVFLFGGPIANSWNMTPIITAADAWAIDNKIDDGKPGSGKVLTVRNSSAFNPTPNCSTTDVQTTAEYNMTVSGLQCVLFFVVDF